MKRLIKTWWQLAKRDKTALLIWILLLPITLPLMLFCLFFMGVFWLLLKLLQAWEVLTNG